MPRPARREDGTREAELGDELQALGLAQSEHRRTARLVGSTNLLHRPPIVVVV